MSFTIEQWVYLAFVLLLGIIIGLLMMTGRNAKWKRRYREEMEHRQSVEAEYKMAETEWRERDSLRAAALKGAGKSDPID